MKLLTVFTPTYNRAFCLPRLYESLVGQASEDFCWLIIDDGSTDNTAELVKGWQKEDRIEIIYYYKENGGLHTAYNLGIEKAETELFVCIDSDDFISERGVELIRDLWRKEGNDSLAGIIGLDYTLDNVPIGEKLPDKKTLYFPEMKIRYEKVGDCKLVHRTELLKKHAPMPVYKGEKNFNPSYLFIKVGLELPLLVLNENLCYVDYQPDGMSRNILYQYKNSPNSFMELRKLYLSFSGTGLSFKARHCIHYISSCLFAGKYGRIFQASNFFLVSALIPFGILLNLYIRFKTR